MWISRNKWNELVSRIDSLEWHRKNVWYGRESVDLSTALCLAKEDVEEIRSLLYPLVGVGKHKHRIDNTSPSKLCVFCRKPLKLCTGEPK